MFIRKPARKITMLLPYGSEDRDSGGAGSADGWLCRGTLASLTVLNELSLGMLAEQAAVRGASGSLLLHLIAELWRSLDASGRRRAAGCPYLLVDAGFADPLRWQSSRAPQIGDAGDGAYAGFFTVPCATEVARLVFTYAWHLARSHEAAARLLLGMPAPTAAAINDYTLRQIHTLAESHTQWLTPRWPTRVQVWRELLLAAASGEPLVLERARLRGLTLLAADARLAPRTERLLAY
jgi:hypothetical protein